MIILSMWHILSNAKTGKNPDNINKYNRNRNIVLGCLNIIINIYISTLCLLDQGNYSEDDQFLLIQKQMMEL